METKGSRKNPYTWSEFNAKVSSGNWSGGWVQNDEEKIYYTQVLGTYDGCCAKNYPVPYDIFNEMEQHSIWLGGWVLVGSSKKYYDINGEEYNSTLGYYNDPCPMRIYEEMTSNEIWESGWVQESNGTIRYIQNFSLTLTMGCGCGSGSGCGCGSGSGCGCGSGSGCGCGSGSGCGCGSGSGSGEPPTNLNHISAGSYDLGYITHGGNQIGHLTLTWSEGNTSGNHNMSVASVSVRALSGQTYDIQENHIVCYWENPYEVTIGGNLLIIYNDDEYYAQITGKYTIPTSYRTREK